MAVPRDKPELLRFLRTHTWGGQSPISRLGAPQSALVGFAVTDRFEMVFDTLDTTRKVANLKRNPQIAFVIGGGRDGDERTVQYQGIADFPEGDELERLKTVYFTAFPDGPSRQTWPGITYARAKPLWIRYSDFNTSPPEVCEWRFQEE